MEVIRKFAVWQMTNDCLPLLRPFKLHHPVSPPCSGYATQRKKFFLFKVNSYKLKPTHTDVKWDRSQIYGLVSHGFSDTPGIIGDGINSTQILVKEFRGAAWTLYSLEAGLFFFFSFQRLAPHQHNPYVTTNLSQSQWSRTFCVHQSTQSLEFTTEYVTKPTCGKKDLLWLMVSDSPVHRGEKGIIGVIVLGAYGTDSTVDQEVEKARPNWGRGYLSNAFSQRQPSTSFSPPPEGLPAVQSSTTSWE